MTPNLKKHDQNVLKAHFAKLGRKGGAARARTMTPEERVASAKRARAAGVAKQQAARERAQEPLGAAGNAQTGVEPGQPVPAPQKPATARTKALRVGPKPRRRRRK